MQPITVNAAQELLAVVDATPQDSFGGFVDQVCATVTGARRLANLVLQDAERPDHEVDLHHAMNCPVCEQELCAHVEAMREVHDSDDDSTPMPEWEQVPGTVYDGLEAT